MMLWEWDEAKRLENLRKHRIDFRDVPALFGGIVLRRLDLRSDYGEDRWVARKANRNERERFDIEISDRLGVSERSE